MALPIRGVVIKQDRQIGAILITGQRSRTPLLALGMYHRGREQARSIMTVTFDQKREKV